MDGTISLTQANHGQTSNDVTSLKTMGVIEIPGGAGSEFDHGIFDARSRRVFITHTARSTVEVIDLDAGRHIATLPGFPGVAGAVADDGEILVTNRAGASVAWLDAVTLRTKSLLPTGARPNGAAIVKRLSLGIAACIGDETEAPKLQAFRLGNGYRVTLDLPGRPRWCVTDAAAERLFLCMRDPSMILVASLPDLRPLARWPLPSSGAHVSISITRADVSMRPATAAISSKSTAVPATSPMSGRSPGRPT